jgi:hypothetical protein
VVERWGRHTHPPIARGQAEDKQVERQDQVMRRIEAQRSLRVGLGEEA